MFTTKFYSVLATASILMLSAGTSDAAEDIAVAAGAKGGPNYPFGRVICSFLKTKDFNCSTLPTPAGDAPDSFANLTNLRNGAVELAIARSDWQYFALTGTGPAKYLNENFESLRSVFSIHSQPFTLLARRDSAIKSLDDLKGKRVNLGSPYSDERASLDLVLAAKNWTKKDFVLAEQLTTAEQSLAFCHDRVQAMHYTVSHPHPAIRKVTELCDAAIVDVSGPAIDKLVADKPYLAIATIPGGLYGGTSEPVKTFGTTVTVVSSSDVSEDLIYTVVKAIFEDLDGFKKKHPALHDLAPSRMIKDGITAPVHPGAMRYFRERGLM